MRPLHNRTAQQAYAFHQPGPVYVYDERDIQWERICITRTMVQNALALIQDGRAPLVIDLGCGSGDVGGWFSQNKNLVVKGYEAGSAQYEAACRRWPELKVTLADIQAIEPVPCDVLILTEVLEHLGDPDQVCRAWMPLARSCVISHPIDGDLQYDLSAGQHNFSYSDEDFERWFRLGGHRLIVSRTFRMGQYLDRVGRSEKIES